MSGSLLEDNEVQKLIFFSEEGWLTLDRGINGKNYRYCGSMKISMQFIKFLHKYLIQWGKRGKLELISHFLYPLHFFLWQSCSMYQYSS